MEQTLLDDLMRMGSKAGEYVTFCTTLSAWSEHPSARAAIADFEPHHVELLFGQAGALLASKAMSCTLQKVQKLLELGFSAHTLVKSLLHLYRKPEAKQLQSFLALLDKVLPYCINDERLAGLAERAERNGVHADVVQALERRTDELRNREPDILDSDGEEGEDLSESKSHDAREGIEDRTNTPLPDDEGASEGLESDEQDQTSLPKEDHTVPLQKSQTKNSQNNNEGKKNNEKAKTKSPSPKQAGKNKNKKKKYHVEAIITERPQYKVRWLGYASSSDTWEVEEHIRGTEAFARYMSAKKSASKQKEAPPGESDSEDDPYEAGEEDEASGSDAAEEQKKKSSELESEDEEELDVLAAALSTSAKKRKRSPAVQIGVLPEVTLTNVIEGKRARPEPGKFAKIARELAEHR